MKALLKRYAPNDVCDWIMLVVFAALALLAAIVTALAVQDSQDWTAAGLGLGMTAFFTAVLGFYASEQLRKRSDAIVNERLCQILKELEQCRCKADGASE